MARKMFSMSMNERYLLALRDCNVITGMSMSEIVHHALDLYFQNAQYQQKRILYHEEELKRLKHEVKREELDKKGRKPIPEKPVKHPDPEPNPDNPAKETEDECPF